MTMDMIRRALAISMIGVFAGLLGACEEQGPAEEVGEAIDDTAGEAGEAVEELGDKVDDATN